MRNSAFGNKVLTILFIPGLKRFMILLPLHPPSLWCQGHEVSCQQLANKPSLMLILL